MKIGGKKLTLAQKMLLAMGLNHEVLLLGHRTSRLVSFRKKGPGRVSVHKLKEVK